MRRLSFFSVLFLLLAGALVMESAAWAGSGSALLPSSTGGNTSNAPNLGLTAPPEAPAPPPAQDTKKPTQPPAKPTKADATPPSTPFPVPPNMPTNTASILSTFSPPNPATMPSPAEQAARLASLKKLQSLAQNPAAMSPTVTFVSDPKSLQPGQLPTIIVNHPDRSALFDVLGQSLPLKLSFHFSDHSTLSAEDAATVTRQLGLSTKEISASCFLSLRGTLLTERGNAIISGMETGAPTANYDGAIKNVILLVEAVCPMPKKLPAGAGVVNQYGERAVVDLGSVFCTPPTHQSSVATVSYNGTAHTSCAYQ